MRTKVRSAVLVALAALSFVTPARAEDPTVLVAARRDGAVVRLTLVGRVAVVDVLVPPREGTLTIPTQALGSSVSYVTAVDGRLTRYDVGVLDAGTGARRQISRDGRSGHLLVSPDRRHHYVLTSDEGTFDSLVRTDASGRNRRTLLARRHGGQLSGSGISRDGRTVYVARTVGDSTSTLYAVSTATGARRVVKHGATPKFVHNVVASPDGRTLAVSYTTPTTSGVVVALVPVDGGEPEVVSTPGDLFASSFTADSGGLVLSHWPYAGHPDVGYVAVTDSMLSLADIASGVLTPIVGTEGLFQAVPVA